MNKLSFITALLESNKLNTSQKERFFRLVAREVESIESSDEKIFKELEFLKTRLGIEREMPGEEIIDLIDNSESSNSTIPYGLNQAFKALSNSLPKKYNDPADLSKFLIAYNQDPVLKYTCHEIDDNEVIEDIIDKYNGSEYDFFEHHKLIQKSYQKLVNKHRIHPNVYSRIYTYLNGGDKTWGAEFINVNWNSQGILVWAQTNNGMVPNPGDNLKNKTKNRGYRLPKPFISQYTGERVADFSNLTTYFKHLFHIRGDNTLKNIIKRVNQKDKWDDRIVFELDHEDFRENLELFTDVDKLVQAYKSIIKMILEVVSRHNLERPRIRISFNQKNDIITLSIHHLNTVFKKTPENLKNRLGDSMTRLITSKINGLADLYLKADFDHGKYAELNLWNGNQININLIEEFKGAEFRLEFKEKNRVTISKEMIEQFQKSIG